jgi:serine/threonine protein kinase
MGDPRSDVFALGVVVYEMIAGRRPFEGSTRARIIASILEHEPVPLTSAHEAVSPALQHLVLRCLAKIPISDGRTRRIWQPSSNGSRRTA